MFFHPCCVLNVADLRENICYCTALWILLANYSPLCRVDLIGAVPRIVKWHPPYQSFINAMGGFLSSNL